jgi:uncharacterized protein (TIGR03083 family)
MNCSRNQEDTMTTLRARRDSVTRDLDAFLSRLHDLNASQWHLPTPNKGWEIRHLAAHLSGTVAFMNEQLRRIVNPDLAAALQQGDAVNEDSPHDRIIGSLTVNRNAIVATLAELTEDLLTAENGDEAVFFAPTGELYLNLATCEAGLHLYDISAALDHGSAGLSIAAVTAGDAVFGAAMAKIGNRNEIKPDHPVTFHFNGSIVNRFLSWTGAEWVDSRHDSVPLTTIQADDTALVLFACGRIPATDHRIGVSGDRDAVQQFKSWIPGP